ncbi:unnamed protein product [Tuwongella immobilis]|uniref:Uncharacterized protein n=1 Tax=Tuwongella immobilis TaxID=692036 RepID=A0A6C2YTX2_9BACT|nr:unnamed protein product [Tuwongella immobilis]VTS06092.1 unnamed protein product [Tuwongella immobilis]
MCPRSSRSERHVTRSSMRLRHSRLEASPDFRPVLELLGHADVDAAIIDTHVLLRNRDNIQSPADLLQGDATGPTGSRLQPNTRIWLVKSIAGGMQVVCQQWLGVKKPSSRES